MAIIDRMVSAWNAFRSTEPTNIDYSYGPPTYSPASPVRASLRPLNDRSIITSIYNRIAIDVADISFRHIKVDEIDRYQEEMKSHLNSCLTVEPNIDQGPRAFRQDLCLTLFTSGAVAIVPVDTTMNPETNEVFDIFTLRVGNIVAWYPKHVKINLYNEAKGLREEITLEKRFVAIVDNPLYSVMNSPSSTLQRILRKFNMLDTIDEVTSSGKLDIIIQLPYVVKSEAKKAQADRRRAELELQLKGSQYGVAYTDGTEKITQLNRPTENNLLKQIEYLTVKLYGELGVTEEVMNGTADEKTMINYHNRTIKPIADAVKEAMTRTFIGLQGIEKSERIAYFNNPFKLVSLSELAEIADKFTRNEVLSSNELRGIIGIPPSKDPKADALINSNLKAEDTRAVVPVPATQASA